MNLLRKSFIILLISASFGSHADSVTVDDIVDGIDKRPTPDTSVMNLAMELVGRRGDVRVRKMRSFSKDMEHKDAMMMFFESPTNVKGTAYLSHDYEDEGREDDSWLYLPAMRRIKRVAGGEESDSFMGSDFSYADINGIELKDWKFSLLEESIDVDGTDCWVLDAVPVPDRYDEIVEETGYDKRQIWVRKDNYFIIRAELHIKRNNRVKYMKVDGLSEIDGFWIADTISMVTTKNNNVIHRSRMHFSDIRLNEELDDVMFSETQMGKGQ